MAIKEMVTTGLSFTQQGVLVPPNTPVLVDTDKMDLDTTLEDENGKKLKGEKDVGLVAPGKREVPAPVVVAPIAPTGPNPTAPQQLAPGSLQTHDGYTTEDGAPLLAAGSDAAADIEVEEGGEPAARKPRRTKAEEALS